MKHEVKLVLGTCIVVAAAGCLTTGPATAEQNVYYSTGDGDTLRARLYEHRNFGGHVIEYLGSSSCSSTTSDIDAKYSSMPGTGLDSWNDQVSSIRDYNSCDIKLYRDINFGGGSSPWLNGSRSDLGSWNDWTSSWAVS